MANNTLIGALRAEATLESGKFVDGARKLRLEGQKTEASLKRSFGNIGTILAAGIGGFIGALGSGLVIQGIRQALEYASSLKEVSQQVGVTTKDLQTLRYAAGQLGVKQGELETGLRNLTKTLGQLAAGAEKPRKALEAIGLSAAELDGLDTGQAFRKIADALEQIPDRAQRAAIEVALFGENGAKLDTLLAGGSSAINNLAAAAEELGIVLSDEQIQKADETADKLEAMKTVLAARFAGVVADNADAILKLAEALMAVAEVAVRATAAFGTFISTALSNPFTRGALLIAGGQPVAGARTIAGAIVGGGGATGSSVTVRLPPPKPVADSGGRDIGRFLAPRTRSRRRGGGARRARQGPADRSEDLAFQFAEEQRRADMDILRAKRDLARTGEERYLINLAILELERQDREAEIANRVRRAEKDAAEGRITQSALEESRMQAEILAAKGNELEALKRQELDDAERQRIADERARVIEFEFDLQQDALEAQLQLATTAEEERDIRLRLLDLSYRQERARLQAVIADETASQAAKDEALERLRRLDAFQATDKVGVLRSTMNPLEAWAASVPQTAAQINESLQSIQAEGLDGIADAITDIVTGTRSMAEAFGDVANQIIADIIRMTVRMLIFRAISGAFGGSTFGAGDINVTSSGGSGAFALPGFASGGSFRVLGRSGVDKNILSINGIPQARVSHGERIDVANDNNGGGSQPITINQTYSFEGVAVTQEQFVRGLTFAKHDTIATIKDMNRR